MMTGVSALLLFLLLRKSGRFLSLENSSSSSLVVSSGKMGFGVTSVQRVSTVCSADHLARLLTVRLTSTDCYSSADLTAEISCSWLHLEIWILPLKGDFCFSVRDRQLHRIPQPDEAICAGLVWLLLISALILFDIFLFPLLLSTTKQMLMSQYNI